MQHIFTELSDLKPVAKATTGYRCKTRLRQFQRENVGRMGRVAIFSAPEIVFELGDRIDRRGGRPSIERRNPFTASGLFHRGKRQKKETLLFFRRNVTIAAH